MVRTSSAKRDSGAPGRSPSDGWRIALLLALLAVILAIVVLVRYFGVQHGLAMGAVLIGGVVWYSIRRRLGRTPHWVGQAFVLLVLLAAAFSLRNTIRALGSEEGRYVLARLNKIPCGETMVVSAEDLEKAGLFTNDVKVIERLHGDLHRLYGKLVARIKADRGRHRAVIETDVFVDPLLRARARDRLRRIGRYLDEAGDELESIQATLRKRYARRTGENTWRANSYAGWVILDHARRAGFGIGSYRCAVNGGLELLDDKEHKDLVIIFSRGKLSFMSEERVFERRYEADIAGILKCQRDFAKEACCDVDDVRIVPDVTLPDYYP